MPITSPATPEAPATPPPASRAPRFTRRTFLKLAGGVGLAAVAHQGAQYARDHVVARTAGLGRDFPFRRMAFLTDLHLPRSMAAVEAAVGQIEEWRPEITVLGGDALDHPAGLDHLADLVPRLRGSVATIAVLGNWEYYSGVGIPALRDWFARRDVQLVGNERLDVGDLQLQCFDDLRLGEPLWPDTQLDRPTVYVAHEPATWRHINAAALLKMGSYVRPMAMLSGHTHGGQIAPMGRPIVLPRGSDRYIRGWYNFSDISRLCVSSGVGTSLIPVRLGVTAEWWKFTSEPFTETFEFLPPRSNEEPVES